MTTAAVVAGLVDIVGKRVTALIAGLTDTASVDALMTGHDDGRCVVEAERLRLALRIAKALLEREDRRVIQAWFMGLNPELGDRSPARLLRDGDLVNDGESVMDAARTFLASG